MKIQRHAAILRIVRLGAGIVSAYVSRNAVALDAVPDIIRSVHGALQQLTGRAPEIELAWTSLARLYLMNHSFELSSMFTPVEIAVIPNATPMPLSTASSE